MIRNARIIEKNYKIDSEITKIYKNQNFDQLKTNLLTSKLICHEGELIVIYVQSKFATFYKEMLKWIKKYKKITRNFSYAKEIENADLKRIYDTCKLFGYEKSKTCIKIVVKHYPFNKQYVIFKQCDLFNLEMFILVYTYSLVLYIMCVYIVFLYSLLYF